MKPVLASTSITLVLTALLAATPAHAQTSLPPGSLNQSKNSLVTKFTKLGFAFSKAQAFGNGFLHHGVKDSGQSSVGVITVKTGVAFVSVEYPGVVGAATDAPENHLVDFQKALKTLLPNWKDGAAWLQAAHATTVADANAGVDTSQKEGAEQVETEQLYITFENALHKESNTVSFNLTVYNVAQVSTLEATTEAPAAAAPEPTAVPAAPVPLVVQPAPAVEQPAPAQTQGNCDPSYPTICIPAGSPDLDCPDITERRFQVLPPDPHRFDGDHDGIGCEK